MGCIHAHRSNGGVFCGPADNGGPVLRHALIATATLATVGLLTTGSAHAAPAADNPWLDARVMNMAHSGGELEAPLNTMYAFDRAVGLGADMIELDVQSTLDDRLVVLHDSSVDATTDGSGEVADLPLSEVRELDAAYNFVPDEGTVPDLPDSAYPLRGVRTGDVTPPAGYTADDFAIPTLAEVFERFPDTPINIEIKGSGLLNTESFLRNARLLAQFLTESGRTDVIVTSFNDAAVAEFHDLAPDVPLAPGTAGIAAYFFAGTAPIDGTVALQIPVTLSNLLPIATESFVERAHNDGYAVHVWFSGTAPDDVDTYRDILNTCADGLMPARPQAFEDLLDELDTVRPGRPGTDPCA